MSDTPPAVSVVLPTANQDDHIAAVVERFRLALQSLQRPYEILLVVNRSRDQTLAVCRRLASAHPEIQVFESPPGWGNAVRVGARAARGKLIAYTNSARTEAEDLALTIQYGLVNEQVVVKASRKLRDSFLRRLGSVLYNFEVRMLFGLAVWDINGTPKVFPRALIPQLGLTEPGDLIDLEFIVNCKRHGIRIVEVPIYAAQRHGGRSTTTLHSAIKMYAGALFSYWRYRRSAATEAEARART